MRVSRKDLANYLDIHPTRVKKHYQAYLDALELKRNYLTVFDIAKVDDISADLVAKIISIDKRKLAVISEYVQS